MDTFPCVFPGPTTLFADVTKRLVSVKNNNRVLQQWYATHPAAMISVVSATAESGITGKEFPKVEHITAEADVSLTTYNDGIKINGRGPSAPVPAVVARLKLIFSVIKRTLILSIDRYWNDNQSLAELLVSLHAESRGTPIARVKSLKTKAFDFMFYLYERLDGQVVEPLCNLQSLSVHSLTSSGKTLDSIEELRNLKELHCRGGDISSLSSISVMQSLCSVEICDTKIKDSDIKILSELRQLRTLNITVCHDMTTLVPFKDHPSLQNMLIGYSEKLKHIELLTTIPTLRRIKLYCRTYAPEEMSRCVRGFMALKFLEQLDLWHARIAEVPVACLCEYSNLQSLTLRNVFLEGFQWITKAPYLTHLSLRNTNVTEKELAEVCGSLYYLEELDVGCCNILKTSLSFLLSMEHIQKVFISKFNLMKGNAVYLLRERGVDIEHNMVHDDWD